MQMGVSEPPALTGSVGWPVVCSDWLFWDVSCVYLRGRRERLEDESSPGCSEACFGFGALCWGFSALLQQVMWLTDRIVACVFDMRRDN